MELPNDTPERLQETVAQLQAREAQHMRDLETLRESEELFRSIYAESPICIEVCDASGEIVDGNAACLDMFGIHDTERRWPSLFRDPYMPESAKAALRRNETVRYEASVDFDGLVIDRHYRGTRHGTGVFDILVSPLSVRVGQSVPGYLIEVQEVTHLKKAETRLRVYQEQLRSLASQLSLVEERERRSLATVLHDEVGQALAVIKIELGLVRPAIAGPDVALRLDEVQAILDDTIRHIRSLTFDLSPPILYELGLEPALEWLAEQHQARHGIPVRMHDDGRPKPLSDDVRGLLYRTIRELLGNVAKHAGAREVLLSVKRAGSNIRIEVKDDGIGFDPHDTALATRGFGLFNIRERLTAIGGHLSIESEPGHGTKITMVAPIATDAACQEHIV